MTPQEMQQIRAEFRQELPAIIAGEDTALQEWANRVKRTPVGRVADVINAVSIETGLPVGAIMGEQRSAYIVRIRHLAIYASHMRFPRKSLSGIGRVFKRDHTTICQALRKFPAKLQDPLLRRCYERVMASIT